MFFSKNKNATADGLWKKPGRGKRGKPKAGFPPFPPPLEIQHNPLDFHFPTAPTTAGISQTTSGNLIVGDRKECLTPDTHYEMRLIDLPDGSPAWVCDTVRWAIYPEEY